MTSIPNSGEVATKQRVEELFTKTVDSWASFHNDPKPPTMGAQNLVSRMRFALDMLEARALPGAKVLDVGCGAGQLTGELMRRGYESWGMDVSQPMVSRASDRFARNRWIGWLGSDQLVCVRAVK